MVNGYYYNFSNQYSGNYFGYTNFFEIIHNINNNFYMFNDVSNGYRNEITVASTIFDIYDPLGNIDDDGWSL